MINTRKFLLAGTLTVAAMQGTVASPCDHSEFYVGANMCTQTYGINEKTGGSMGDEKEDGEKYKRTKPLAELLVGYDRKIEDFKLGVELLAGTVIGKMRHRNREYEAPEYETETFKMPWSISLMPRVGYMVTPKFELYGTFGARVANIRLVLREKYVEYESEKKYKRSRNRIQPLVGVGMRYEISNCAFAKLEYNYGFDTPLKFRFGKALARGRLQAHTAKLGFGYRF